MILGLTGGVASGKSTVSKILKEMGYKVYDADVIAHEILETNQVKSDLKKEFGNSISSKEGEIDRRVLREIVFRDRENLLKLNSIIHPIVISEFESIKEENGGEIENNIIIFDIPLLFEVNLEYLCDKILLIYTDRETQIKRIVERDGSSRELAEKMIDSQESIESKKSKSDFCIENSRDINYLKNEIITILEKIQKEG